ncbi:MAG: IS3 family transposase, partial [Planctomycetota bacterium]
MVQKKIGSLSREEKWSWIDPTEPVLSLEKQCCLLGLARSSWYYEPVETDSEDVTLMNLIDAQYTETPFYGSRKMVISLRHLGYGVSRKRVQRLMRLMGIAGVCPGPNTSRRRMEHVVYPYLLRGFVIDRPNQVWSTDITYIRLKQGFVYLVAIIDW